jgi:3,5-epimerase/4-reductase
MTDMVILGGRGFIGSQLRAMYPDAAAPSGDIADPVWVRSMFDALKPGIVINAAGKTGKPNVDWCETHRVETLRSNVVGPLVLLEECLKRECYFVHIGSGCIYDGTRGTEGFTEEDMPNFTGSFYSLTKATSDQMLKPFPVLQLRLRMPFDDAPGPRNLLTKLAGYKKILDVRNSITYIPDFLRVLKTLVAKHATGIYNVVNPGAISPYEIMQRYQQLVDSAHTFERLTLEDLSTVVCAARSNCILSTKKLEREGIKLFPVHEAIDQALLAIKKSKSK